MTNQKRENYREALTKLAIETGATSKSLEEATRAPNGGENAGSLSNTPMHLGDLGSEAYTQELNATLLESEDAIRQEVMDALERLDGDSFGICEECEVAIPQERLEVVPYARYCVPCTEKMETSSPNLNSGRPAGWGSTFDHPAALAGRKRSGEQSPFNAPRAKTNASDDDSHAAGTPGGGSAIGGLGGTNIGDGEPGGQLEDAMGSGNFDTNTDADEAELGDGYAGRSGGAVGGTPANKRARGGKTPPGSAKSSKK